MDCSVACERFSSRSSRHVPPDFFSSAAALPRASILATSDLSARSTRLSRVRSAITIAPLKIITPETAKATI